MENIILTNNKDLRLVSVKVGVLSTLRFELPLVSASATHVEVIVTSGSVHSAYTATFIDATKRWQCDIAASQFPTVGKQSYEIAYVLDGKQFWDGKGWIEIEDATTSGIEPQPRPEPYRYAVVSVNGYGADAQGAVRIPKTFIAINSPTMTDGFMEGDIYFNRSTGATWTLCNVQGTLTWVFNYKNYYTKAETEEAIDRVAAYYITYDAAGNPFPTYAALANATTVYSGGVVRVPTRNDYCVVLADETHQGAEYRYIYAVAEGETTGSWQPQFPVEGVMTVDQTVQKNSQNPVSGGGVWSAIWGALSALPTGFTSLYDWAVAQLAGKASKSDVDPLLFAQYYPDGNVKSAAEFTQGIKYDAPDMTNRTITVKPFCNTGTAANDNSGLVGRVVIPPFVDAQGNPYISDDGTRYKVVGVSGFDGRIRNNTYLTAIFAPNTLTTIGGSAFIVCTEISSVSIPSATIIGEYAFSGCVSLTSVDFGGTPRSSVPMLGNLALLSVPATCKIIVPYTQYDSWTAASGWSDLPQEFVRHAEKADKPATFTAGHLAALDASGNPTDSAIPSANVALKGDIPYSLGTAIVVDSSLVQVDNTDPNNPITFAEVVLANRTANIVQVTAATELDELRITFPAATSGKVRDFGLRVEIGTGSAALTAPALVPVAPTGETIKIENNAAEIPALADGTATAKGVTLLYFSENAPGIFVVKGEQVEEVA